MAAASYTTDLTTVNILDSESSPVAVGEPTGSTGGTTITTETDHYVVGAACISKIYNAVGVGGLGFLNPTAVTVPTDGAVYMWTNFLAANSISTKANGGMQILVGNTAANYKRFYVYGDDTIEYGGWQVNAVDPAQTASATQGTPNGTWQYFGMAANVDFSVARGYPLCWDAVRAGRGSIIMTGGDLANGYATFDAAAEVNDTNTDTGPVYNRWGIFSFTNGTYTLQGRLAFGSSGTAVDFRDANRAIFIKSTDFVTTNFNTLEIINAASRVDWTSIAISSLTTVSRGRVLVTDNADFNVESCTFTDMGTFSFLSNTTVNATTFRRCGTITHGNSIFTNNLITGSYATTAMTTATPETIQDNQFVSAGTGHAITITAPGTYTFSGNLFTGYGATGTTNAAIYNNSGGAITLNISGGGDVPTYRNGTSASTTIIAAANVTLTGLLAGTEVRAYVGTDPATSTLIGGVESSTTSFTFSQSVAGQTGYLQIFHVDRQPIYQPITYSGLDTTIPIQQTIDRQYANPV
jgi:hypothetical protein